MSAVPFDAPRHLVSAVFIDHLRAAFREPVEAAEEALLSLMADHWADTESPMQRHEVELIVTDRAGNFGEARAWSFRGLTLCRVLAPGRSTRGVGHLVIDGSSCRLFSDGFWRELAAMGQRRSWVVKRADLAVDDDSGVLSVDALEEAYDLGFLSHETGGAPRVFDPRDPRRGTASSGWTVYVGERTGSAMVRIYDKVSEVRAKKGAACADLLPAGRVRVELERKHVKGGAPLPWDMVADPAPYFAADCPLLQMRSGGVSPVRVGRVVRDQAEADLWALLGHCRNSYGAAIEQAFWALGADDEAAAVLLSRLRRPGSKPPVPGVAEVAGGGAPDAEFVP